MKYWQCPNCHRFGTALDNKDAEELTVDIRKTTILLEDPKRAWTFFCSALNMVKTLKRVDKHNFEHKLKSIEKTLSHLMSMFIEEQKYGPIPNKEDCGCQKKDRAIS